jgi:hypothetical protein
VVYQYDGVKWIGQTGTGALDLSAVAQDIVPDGDNTRKLGSPTNQWQDVFVSTGSIYIGNVKLSNQAGKLITTTVVNPGEETEEPDPDDSDASSEIRTVSELVNNEHIFKLENDGSLTLDGESYSSGGEGLGTITIPETTGTNYKGLQVSYGMIHTNSSNSELNVNKIVIHKPAITTTTIDPTSGEDDFKVSGLGSSDVLALFVLYGDVNGPKALSTLTNFAETIIDTVILDGGVEGQYNTVDQMKSAFYSNYSTISANAGGLDADFEFFFNYTNVNTGTTTVLEGSGASLNIFDNGDTTYSSLGVTAGGINYQVGHKILVPGTSLGGVSPDNDCLVTVTAASSGEITGYSVSGTAALSGSSATYNAVTGTNYQVGSGLEINQILFTNSGEYSGFNYNSQGSNYVPGDVLTLLGSGIQNGVSPDNDITITVTFVDGSGMVTAQTPTGVYPRTWPSNYVGDGGNDQYDDANYINTNLASEIDYNQGLTVADGVAAFGTGSSYTFVYNTGTFGLFVTGNSAEYIETSGNSGADGSSTTEAGNLYGPNTAEVTYTNAVSHITLVSQAYAGPIVSFTHTDGGSEVDILIPDDGAGAGVGITRNNNNGIYNPYREGSWDSGVSPGGTLWNIDGWTDLSDVPTRTYTNLYAAFGNGGLGNKIVGTECVMYLPDNGKYYAVKFDSWTQGGGGGFAYTRRELDLDNLKEGVRFTDGTVLKSAEGLGRIKQTASNGRRIEEVYGTSQINVTSRTTTNLTTTASRAGSGISEIWIDATTTTIDNIIDTPSAYDNAYDFEFSMDDINWYSYGGYSTDGNERGYGLTSTFTYNQGDTVYFRYKTGGTPVVWWDAADLPGGSSNFRGAVIDYHAYSGEATWIGSIHIVKDSGEEHISHTEVGSGTTDSENDDLWVVQNEGTISYRRIDGESKTLKVQWAARVFYGSEFYD